MQRDFIKYNRELLGKPEIFGRSAWRERVLGGGDEHGQQIQKEEIHEEEDRMFDEDENGNGSDGRRW